MRNRDRLVILFAGLVAGCASPTPLGYTDDGVASGAGATGASAGSGGDGGALPVGGAGGSGVTVGSGGGQVEHDLYLLATPLPISGTQEQHIYKLDPQDLAAPPIDLGTIECPSIGQGIFLADIAVDESGRFYGVTLDDGADYRMVRLESQGDGTLSCAVLGAVAGIEDEQLNDAPLAMAPASIAGAQGVVLLGPWGDLFVVDPSTLELEAIGHIPPASDTMSYSLDLTLVENDGQPMGFVVSNGNVAQGPVVTAPRLYQFDPTGMDSSNALLGTIDRGPFHDPGGCPITWTPWDLNNGGLVAYNDKIIGFFTDNAQPGLSVYEVGIDDASVCITHNHPNLHPYGAAMVTTVPFVPPTK